MKVDYLVLGAGISGLACAHERAKEGKNAVVFEAENYYGGLCHSFNINGFTFDSAVHLSFTKNNEAREFFDKTPCISHLPISYNYYNGLWLKHPLINNMSDMSALEKTRFLKSLIEKKEYRVIANYGEWLKASYGDLIAEKFYYIYTKKYWTVRPEDMSTSWIGSRLNTPDLEKILYGSFDKNTEIDYYAKEMRYPFVASGRGGYVTFLKPLLKGIKVIYNKKAIHIDLNLKRVYFSDNTSCHYEHLVSSIPLPELVNICGYIPDYIQKNASKLKASKISIVSVGFNKSNIAKYLWFYIYDDDILAARVNSPSIKSTKNAPEGSSSMQFEVYHYHDDIVDKQKIIENVRYSLNKMKICQPEDIIFIDYKLLPFGNVIFLKEMEIHRNIVRNYLLNKGVTLIGRFGKWEYLWSDESYLSGKNILCP